MFLLVSITISITTSDTATTGENYNLMCSVTVTGSNVEPTITWLAGGSEISSDSSRTVSATTSDGSNGYSSTLTFNSLSASHTGTYTCNATVHGKSKSDTEVVSVLSEFSTLFIYG